MKLAESFCLSQRTKNKNLICCKIDFKRAFFQIKEKILEKDKKVCIVLPKELQGGREGDERICMRLHKEVPGTKTAPMAWYRTLSKVLCDGLGFTRSRVDPCLFTRHIQAEGHVLQACLFVHVDDSRIWLPEQSLPWLRESLATAGIETRYITRVESTTDLVGMRWTTTEAGTYLDQRPYIEKNVKIIPLRKIDARKFEKPGSIQVGTELYDQFRSLLGKFIWLLKTRPEYEFDVSILASRVHQLCFLDLEYANVLAQCFLDTIDRQLFLPAIELEEGETLTLQGVCDASLAGDAGSRPLEAPRAQGARAIGLSSTNKDIFCPIDVSSRKIRRVSSSSFDAEMLILVELADMLCVIRLLLEELQYGIRPSLIQRILAEVEGWVIERPPILCFADTDAKDCVERIYSVKDSITISKRRRVDVSDCQDLVSSSDITAFRHVMGSTNPLDCITKRYGFKGIAYLKASYQRFLQMLYHGIYVPDLTCSNRKL